MLFASSALTNIATPFPLCFSRCTHEECGISQIAAAALISFICLASLLGRVGLGALADRIGLIRLCQVTVLVLGVSYEDRRAVNREPKDEREQTTGPADNASAPAGRSLLNR